MPDADARQIRLRFRRHRAPDAAGQDAHARLDLHSAGLPCRRPALSRHGADGVAHPRARTDRGARLSSEDLLRRRRAVRALRGHRAGAGGDARGALPPSTRRCAARKRARRRRSCSTSPATAISTWRPTSTTSRASWSTRTTTRTSSPWRSPDCRASRRSIASFRSSPAQAGIHCDANCCELVTPVAPRLRGDDRLTEGEDTP